MIDVQVSKGFNKLIKIVVNKDFILTPFAFNPKADRYLDVEYERGASQKNSTLFSVKSVGKTLARIAFICIQNNMLFDINSVTKKRFIPDDSDGICLELPLSDEMMIDLFNEIQSEMLELSISVQKDKERNGFDN